jgi:hypothetical protein
MIAGIVSGLFGLILFLIKAAISVLYLAFWVWMLIHAIGNKGLSDGEKVVWVLVIIFLPVLGSILYFFIGKPKGL